MPRPLLLTAAFTATLVLTACQWRQTDRRWVSDRRFHQVWEYHESAGSIEETERLLRDQPWRPGEINECLYRIRELESAQTIHGAIHFPPQGEPRPAQGRAILVQ